MLLTCPFCKSNDIEPVVNGETVMGCTCNTCGKGFMLTLAPFRTEALAIPREYYGLLLNLRDSCSGTYEFEDLPPAIEDAWRKVCEYEQDLGIHLPHG